MKVILSKQVHGCFAALSTVDVFLDREAEMPSMPSPGLSVGGGVYEEDTSWADTVKEVYLNIDTGEVTAHVEEDMEIYNAQLQNRKHRPIEEIVAEYVKTGWKPRE